MSNGIQKLRTSKNGKEVFALPIGTIEGTKAKFSSGNTGFRMFGRVMLGNKQYQVTGNVVEL